MDGTNGNGRTMVVLLFLTEAAIPKIRSTMLRYNRGSVHSMSHCFNNKQGVSSITFNKVECKT